MSSKKSPIEAAIDQEKLKREIVTDDSNLSPDDFIQKFNKSIKLNNDRVNKINEKAAGSGAVFNSLGQIAYNINKTYQGADQTVKEKCNELAKQLIEIINELANSDSDPNAIQIAANNLSGLTNDLSDSMPEGEDKSAVQQICDSLKELYNQLSSEDSDQFQYTQLSLRALADQLKIATGVTSNTSQFIRTLEGMFNTLNSQNKNSSLLEALHLDFSQLGTRLKQTQDHFTAVDWTVADKETFESAFASIENLQQNVDTLHNQAAQVFDNETLEAVSLQGLSDIFINFIKASDSINTLPKFFINTIRTNTVLSDTAKEDLLEKINSLSASDFTERFTKIFNERFAERLDRIIKNADQNDEISRLANVGNLAYDYDRSFSSSSRTAANIVQLISTYNITKQSTLNPIDLIRNIPLSGNLRKISNQASKIAALSFDYDSQQDKLTDTISQAKRAFEQGNIALAQQLLSSYKQNHHIIEALQNKLLNGVDEITGIYSDLNKNQKEQLGPLGKDIENLSKNVIEQHKQFIVLNKSLGIEVDRADIKKVKQLSDKIKEFGDKAEETGKKSKESQTNLTNIFSTLKNTVTGFFSSAGSLFNALGLGTVALGPISVAATAYDFHAEQGRKRYASMSADASIGVLDLNTSAIRAQEQMLYGNDLYVQSGGRINQYAVRDSYESLIREVGGQINASPEQTAEDLNYFAHTTSLLQNVYGVSQSTINESAKVFYRDMRLSAHQAANALAKLTREAQAAGLPVDQYISAVNELAKQYMKIGIVGDRAGAVLNNLISHHVRLDIAKEVANQLGNAMGNFAQDKNKVALSALMLGEDPWQAIADMAYTHEANGDPREAFIDQAVKYADVYANVKASIYGDDPNFKLMGLIDTYKEYGLDARTASMMADDRLKNGITDQFKEKFKKAISKAENPNGELEELNETIYRQLQSMTSQLAQSDRLEATLRGQLFTEAKHIGKNIDTILKELGPLLITIQEAMLEFTSKIVDWLGKLVTTDLFQEAKEKLVGALSYLPEILLAFFGFKFAKFGWNILKTVLGPIFNMIKNVAKDPKKLAKLPKYLIPPAILASALYALSGDEETTNDDRENTDSSIIDPIKKIFANIFSTSGKSESDKHFSFFETSNKQPDHRQSEQDITKAQEQLDKINFTDPNQDIGALGKIFQGAKESLDYIRYNYLYNEDTDNQTIKNMRTLLGGDYEHYNAEESRREDDQVDDPKAKQLIELYNRYRLDRQLIAYGKNKNLQPESPSAATKPKDNKDTPKTPKDDKIDKPTETDDDVSKVLGTSITVEELLKENESENLTTETIKKIQSEKSINLTAIEKIKDYVTKQKLNEFYNIYEKNFNKEIFNKRNSNTDTFDIRTFDRETVDTNNFNERTTNKEAFNKNIFKLIKEKYTKKIDEINLYQKLIEEKYHYQTNQFYTPKKNTYYNLLRQDITTNNLEQNYNILGNYNVPNNYTINYSEDSLNTEYVINNTRTNTVISDKADISINPFSINTNLYNDQLSTEPLINLNRQSYLSNSDTIDLNSLDSFTINLQPATNINLTNTNIISVLTIDAQQVFTNNEFSLNNNFYRNLIYSDRYNNQYSNLHDDTQYNNQIYFIISDILENKEPSAIPFSHSIENSFLTEYDKTSIRDISANASAAEISSKEIINVPLNLQNTSAILIGSNTVPEQTNINSPINSDYYIATNYVNNNFNQYNKAISDQNSIVKLFLNSISNSSRSNQELIDVSQDNNYQFNNYRFDDYQFINKSINKFISNKPAYNNLFDIDIQFLPDDYNIQYTPNDTYINTLYNTNKNSSIEFNNSILNSILNNNFVQSDAHEKTNINKHLLSYFNKIISSAERQKNTNTDTNIDINYASIIPADIDTFDYNYIPYTKKDILPLEKLSTTNLTNYLFKPSDISTNYENERVNLEQDIIKINKILREAISETDKNLYISSIYDKDILNTTEYDLQKILKLIELNERIYNKSSLDEISRYKNLIQTIIKSKELTDINENDAQTINQNIIRELIQQKLLQKELLQFSSLDSSRERLLIPEKLPKDPEADKIEKQERTVSKTLYDISQQKAELTLTKFKQWILANKSTLDKSAINKELHELNDRESLQELPREEYESVNITHKISPIKLVNTQTNNTFIKNILLNELLSRQNITIPLDPLTDNERVQNDSFKEFLHKISNIQSDFVKTVIHKEISDNKELQKQLFGEELSEDKIAQLNRSLSINNDYFTEQNINSSEYNNFIKQNYPLQEKITEDILQTEQNADIISIIEDLNNRTDNYSSNQINSLNKDTNLINTDNNQYNNSYINQYVNSILTNYLNSPINYNISNLNQQIDLSRLNIELVPSKDLTNISYNQLNTINYSNILQNILNSYLTEVNNKNVSNEFNYSHFYNYLQKKYQQIANRLNFINNETSLLNINDSLEETESVAPTVQNASISPAENIYISALRPDNKLNLLQTDSSNLRTDNTLIVLNSILNNLDTNAPTESIVQLKDILSRNTQFKDILPNDAQFENTAFSGAQFDNTLAKNIPFTDTQSDNLSFRNISSIDEQFDNTASITAQSDEILFENTQPINAQFNNITFDNTELTNFTKPDKNIISSIDHIPFSQADNTFSTPKLPTNYDINKLPIARQQNLQSLNKSINTFINYNNTRYNEDNYSAINKFINITASKAPVKDIVQFNTQSTDTQFIDTQSMNIQPMDIQFIGTQFDNALFNGTQVDNIPQVVLGTYSEQLDSNATFITSTNTFFDKQEIITILNRLAQNPAAISSIDTYVDRPFQNTFNENTLPSQLDYQALLTLKTYYTPAQFSNILDKISILPLEKANELIYQHIEQIKYDKNIPLSKTDLIPSEQIEPTKSDIATNINDLIEVEYPFQTLDTAIDKATREAEEIAQLPDTNANEQLSSMVPTTNDTPSQNSDLPTITSSTFITLDNNSRLNTAPEEQSNNESFSETFNTETSNSESVIEKITEVPVNDPNIVYIDFEDPSTPNDNILPEHIPDSTVADRQVAHLAEYGYLQNPSGDYRQDTFKHAPPGHKILRSSTATVIVPVEQESNENPNSPAAQSNMDRVIQANGILTNVNETVEQLLHVNPITTEVQNTDTAINTHIQTYQNMRTELTAHRINETNRQKEIHSSIIDINKQNQTLYESREKDEQEIKSLQTELKTRKQQLIDAQKSGNSEQIQTITEQIKKYSERIKELQSNITLTNTQLKSNEKKLKENITEYRKEASTAISNEIKTISSKIQEKKDQIQKETDSGTKATEDLHKEREEDKGNTTNDAAKKANENIDNTDKTLIDTATDTINELERAADDIAKKLTDSDKDSDKDKDIAKTDKDNAANVANGSSGITINEDDPEDVKELKRKLIAAEEEKAQLQKELDEKNKENKALDEALQSKEDPLGSKHPVKTAEELANPEILKSRKWAAGVNAHNADTRKSLEKGKIKEKYKKIAENRGKVFTNESSWVDPTRSGLNTKSLNPNSDLPSVNFDTFKPKQYGDDTRPGQNFVTPYKMNAGDNVTKEEIKRLPYYRYVDEETAAAEDAKKIAYGQRSTKAYKDTFANIRYNSDSWINPTAGGTKAKFVNKKEEDKKSKKEKTKLKPIDNRPGQKPIDTTYHIAGVKPEEVEKILQDASRPDKIKGYDKDEIEKAVKAGLERYRKSKEKPKIKGYSKFFSPYASYTNGMTEVIPTQQEYVRRKDQEMRKKRSTIILPDHIDWGPGPKHTIAQFTTLDEHDIELKRLARIDERKKHSHKPEDDPTKKEYSDDADGSRRRHADKAAKEINEEQLNSQDLSKDLLDILDEFMKLDESVIGDLQASIMHEHKQLAAMTLVSQEILLKIKEAIAKSGALNAHAILTKMSNGQVATSINKTYSGWGAYDIRKDSGVTAEQIDKMFDKDGSVLKGYGKLIYDEAKKQGLDPAIVAGIIAHESDFGRSPAVTKANNPGGIMDWDNNWQTVREFASLEEGIKYTIKNLKHRYLDQGRYTLGAVADEYAPVGAVNDPNNLNAGYADKVGNILHSEFGLAKPTSSVTLTLPTAIDTFNTTGFKGILAGANNAGLSKDDISSPIGERHGRTHQGIDFAYEGIGEQSAFSAGAGKVSYTGWDENGYGNFVIVDHGEGLETVYGHLASIDVKNGQQITAGQAIGKIGSTGRSSGDHLHFEVRKNNERILDNEYVYNIATRGININAGQNNPAAVAGTYTVPPNQGWQVSAIPGYKQDVSQWEPSLQAEFPNVLCGSTAAADLISSVTGTKVTPTDIYNKYGNIGLDNVIPESVLKDYNINYTYIEQMNQDPRTQQLAQQALQQGIPILIGTDPGSPSPWSNATSGHYITAVGLNANGELIVSNPGDYQHRTPHAEGTLADLSKYSGGIWIPTAYKGQKLVGVGNIPTPNFSPSVADNIPAREQLYQMINTGQNINLQQYYGNQDPWLLLKQQQNAAEVIATGKPYEQTREKLDRETEDINAEYDQRNKEEQEELEKEQQKKVKELHSQDLSTAGVPYLQEHIDELKRQHPDWNKEQIYTELDKRDEYKYDNKNYLKLFGITTNNENIEHRIANNLRRGIGPNGVKFSQNDIKYLTNNGYTKNQAYAALAADDKYKYQPTQTNAFIDKTTITGSGHTFNSIHTLDASGTHYFHIGLNDPNYIKGKGPIISNTPVSNKPVTLNKTDRPTTVTDKNGNEIEIFDFRDEKDKDSPSVVADASEESPETEKLPTAVLGEYEEFPEDQELTESPQDALVNRALDPTRPVTLKDKALNNNEWVNEGINSLKNMPTINDALRNEQAKAKQDQRKFMNKPAKANKKDEELNIEFNLGSFDYKLDEILGKINEQEEGIATMFSSIAETLTTNTEHSQNIENEGINRNRIARANINRESGNTEGNDFDNLRESILKRFQ